jgi:hypothetical protein
MSLGTPLGRVYSSPTTAQKYWLAIGFIVVAQAAWLGTLASRGWYYQDDFTFLAEATDRSFGWQYLSEPLNDHLVPGLRASFWLMQHFAPFNYALTIAVRLVLQAVATVLLFRLLVLLVARRPGILYVISIYAFSPLLIPGFLWLSTSTNVLPSQICALLTYEAHIRYVRTRKLRWSIVAGLALVSGVSFWEKTAVTSILLVVLSFGWLTTGSAAARFRILLSDRIGWLLTFGPLAAFLTYFVLAGYGASGKVSSLPAGRTLAWSQWSRTLWPSLLGGPWRWFHSGEIYASLGNPTMGTIVLGQIAFGIALILGVRLVGWRALLAWAMPAISVVVGMTLVGLGRYELFGGLVPLSYSYAFDLGIPLALALCLSTMRATGHGHSIRQAPVNGRRLSLLIPIATLVCFAASAFASGSLFDARWGQNPSRKYVTNLVAQTKRAGSSLNLYDTGLPLNVVPFVAGNRHVSDVLGIAHLKPRFNGSESEPQVVDESGSIRPATLLILSRAIVQPNDFCTNLIRGVSTRTVLLSHSLGENQYFLRLDYFEQRPTNLRITVHDTDGKDIRIIANTDVHFDAGLGSVFLQLDTGRPASVTTTSQNAATNLCITSLSVGIPFPKS